MVSIIGAGAAGSSAAYWLSLANKRLGMNMGITVYENSSRIGGRSTVVHPYDDETLPPIELGASIFVKENRNMMRAAKEFNLTLRDHGDKSNRMGIWDGCTFVLEVGFHFHFYFKGKIELVRHSLDVSLDLLKEQYPRGGILYASHGVTGLGIR